jgi:hypothetical protein
MDPRVTTPRAALARQLAVSLQLSAAMKQAYDAVRDSASGPRSSTQVALRRLLGEISELYSIAQNADAAPTAQASQAIAERLRALPPLLARRKEERATLPPGGGASGAAPPAPQAPSP